MFLEEDIQLLQSFIIPFRKFRQRKIDKFDGTVRLLSHNILVCSHEPINLLPCKKKMVLLDILPHFFKSWILVATKSEVYHRFAQIRTGLRRKLLVGQNGSLDQTEVILLILFGEVFGVEDSLSIARGVGQQTFFRYERDFVAFLLLDKMLSEGLGQFMKGCR